jgi:hypothetical protein
VHHDWSLGGELYVTRDNACGLMFSHIIAASSPRARSAFLTLQVTVRQDWTHVGTYILVGAHRANLNVMPQDEHRAYPTQA